MEIFSRLNALRMASKSFTNCFGGHRLEINLPRRLPASPLIVKNNKIIVGQPIHLGQ